MRLWIMKEGDGGGQTILDEVWRRCVIAGVEPVSSSSSSGVNLASP
jgi:hypothetical protein